MTLDLRTIMLLLIVSSVLMALTLTIGIRTGRTAVFTKWNAGLGLLALGWLLVASREALPALVGVALADAILVTGLCVELVALIEFGGGRPSRMLMFAPGALVLVGVTILLDNYALVTGLVGLVLAALFGGIAVAAARLGAEVGPARWVLAATNAACAIMLPARAFVIWLNPQEYPNVFATSNLPAATFVMIFANTIIVPVTFLLMHRERAEAQLIRLATVDPLTGLLNRRAFMDLSGRELERARRQRSNYAVLMMDLDLFKRVNDEYGHQAGDRVLADFAAVARRSLRTVDVLGRYGGEEFCAVLPDTTMEKGIAIAERVRAAVSQRPLGDLPRAITISIGVAACAGAAGVTLDAAIGRADAALYSAKEAGRDRVVGLECVAPAGAGAAA